MQLVTAFRCSARRGAAIAVLAALALCQDVTTRAEPAVVSRLHWLIEGEVRTAARIGQTLYVGGLFNRLAPAANVLPPVYALSRSTGQVVQALPSLDGRVTQILPDGTGGCFLAGDFVTHAPVRRHLVHVTAAGALDAAFDAQLVAPIQGVALVGERLFAFGLVPPSSTSDSLIVAVSSTTGASVGWSGPARGVFSPAAILGFADRIVVVGADSTPTVRSGVAVAYGVATGAELWRTVVAPGGVGLPGRAWAVVHDGGDLFVAHTPTITNGGLSRLSIATGAIESSWNPGFSPEVLAVDGTHVYAGGVFTDAPGLGTFTGVVAVNRASREARRRMLANGPVSHIEVTAAAELFVAGQFSLVNGQARHRLVEIATTGAPTPWVADVGPNAVFALALGPSNSVLVSSSVAAFGSVARRNTAAFDLDSGALLPWEADVPSIYGVTFIGGDSNRLHITEGLSTQAYDPATGAVVGPLLFLIAAVHADSDWLYTVTVDDCCTNPRGHALRRRSLATGDEDLDWRPAVPLPLAGSRNIPPLAFASDARRVYVSHVGVGTVAIDRLSGRVLWASPAPALRLVVTGDTLIAVGGSGVETYDAATGRPISTGLGVGITGLSLADGRLVVSEADGAGGQRLAAYRLDGTRFPWDPRIGRMYPSATRDRLFTLGDVVVAAGAFETRTPQALQGLAVFDLDGARVPTALQSRHEGLATTFAWTPPTPAPDGYVVEAGVWPGPFAFTVPVATPPFRAVVPPGTFTVRVRTVGSGSGTGEVSNSVLVGCQTAPSPPTGVESTIVGNAVTVAWRPPEGPVAAYRLEVGSAAGLSNIGVIAVAGDVTTFAAAGVPAGTYFLRARASNACGTGAQSGDLRVTVGAGVPLPAAPTGVTVVTGPPLAPGVEVRWTPPPGTVTGYVIEAGSAPGLSNLASVEVGAVTSVRGPALPPGVYFVRVRAMNAAGTGPASEEHVLHAP